MFWCFFVKLIFYTRFKKVSKKYCFCSLHYNFFEKNNLTYDKNYGLAPLKKNKNFSYYLINIAHNNEFFFKIFGYKSKFKKLKIPFFISDEYIKFSDIIKIYFFSVISVIKIIFHIKNGKKYFKINQKDCSNVLFPMLIDSFSGNIQESLVYAKALNNFFNINSTKTFINYFEFNPGFRSSYFFVRKTKFSKKIITVQHAYANKNLLYYFNKRKEFSKIINDEGKYYSPSPDFYLLQGMHFKRLLDKYYPKKKEIIGALKYDLINFNFKRKIQNKKIKNKKRTILICPSVGDVGILISQLKKCNLNNVRLILSPHPHLNQAAKQNVIQKFNEGLGKSVNLEVFENLSSFELIFYSDLVICSHSTLAIESLICGVPSVRVINPNHPFFFDLNDGVFNTYSSKKLNIFINSKSKIIVKRKRQDCIRNIFYKLDNKTYLRFWSFIKKQNL